MRPLVSVLICTHGNRAMFERFALPSYLRQDYENLELIVVDSSCDPISDLVHDTPGLIYYTHCSYKGLGAKRNEGCLAANGEIIVHMDSDDWSGPHRVSDQVNRLLMINGAQLGGYSSAFWYDFVEARASHYTGFIWGATMAYRRDYALENPWDETELRAEDISFTAAAIKKRNAIVSSDGGEHFVATLHQLNERKDAGKTSNWPYVDLLKLPAGFREVIQRENDAS